MYSSKASITVNLLDIKFSISEECIEANCSFFKNSSLSFLAFSCSTGDLYDKSKPLEFTNEQREAWFPTRDTFEGKPILKKDNNK